MNEDDFEGSLVLEQLASLGLVDEFYEAIDADDVTKIVSLLRQADIDEDSIQMVLQKLGD